MAEPVSFDKRYRELLTQMNICTERGAIQVMHQALVEYEKSVEQRLLALEWEAKVHGG